MDKYGPICKELISFLPTSTFSQRRMWAIRIIEENVPLTELSMLLSEDRKVATRFLWLLSDVGTEHPPTLLESLPSLLALCEQTGKMEYVRSFVSYWRIVGVPEQNEARALDYLFEWFMSPTINVTTKSRALFVLYDLTKKYPELRTELRASIESQLNHYSHDFKRRCEKIIVKLTESHPSEEKA